jgi:AraC-like DNA-binding protein
MVVVVSGEAVVTENGERVATAAGCLSLVPAGVTRSIAAGGDGAHCLIVSAESESPFARHEIWNRAESQSLHFKLDDIPHALIAALENDTPALALLEEECIGLFNHLVEHQQRSQPVWLRDALTRLSEMKGRAGASQSVAREIGVHSVHVARTVRRFTGFTMRDYVRRERIRAALELIATTPWSLSRIAHETGFADHSHFTHEFVRRVGVVPSAHRREAARNVSCVQVSDVPAVQIGHVTEGDQLNGAMSDATPEEVP